ncbi:hypothetical protein SAMD00019534_056950 [Acytostelium subglobosum LB1]|uniref:hypothetical protein n=1 Tax=Acytostelium subglobosum LB1 TaxID=1410327 RepID=UPI0006450DDF|nr:hypothetical protein SAMD00019534_056950 [Acytostelium subglobosum LB1]GAM22520.1 hypothetical protein SAMD00019534_056950 [Acytostelium subglobosum LB1]|eukprot:XP_012754640.1 hypothetical protein SAMD00019534_056950 [Acytostelium subglobosum LB1]
MELQDLINRNRKTIDRDISLSSKKHIVVTCSEDSKLYEFNEIIEFFKEKIHHPGDKKNYWIDFQSLENDEIMEICNLLGIHPLTQRDIIKEGTREKCEIFSKHLYVAVNELHYAEGSNHLVTGTLNIILFQNLVLTFHAHMLLSTSQVVRMIKYKEEGALSSSAWIIYAYLDSIVDLYVDLVEKIIMETESLDELVSLLSGLKQNELFTRIGLAGRRVTSLHSGIFEKSEIISVLLRDEKLIPLPLHSYLRNVQDSVVRMTQKLSLCRRLLGDLNNMYMARVSLEVSDHSNRMNITMRKFTAISSIFIPLICVTSVLGMNIKYPGMVEEDVNNNYNSFIGVMCGMIGFALISALLFKRAGWL